MTSFWVSGMLLLDRFSLALLLCASTICAGHCASSIDREALVRRNNPRLSKLDVDAPLTVGNGQFAFGVDITGLQTFPVLYHRLGVPVETQARWCWISEPNNHGYTLDQASREYEHPDGTIVRYPTLASSPAGDWLRRNPRIMPVGQLALYLDKKDGEELLPEEIVAPQQELDMWSGIIQSCYKLDGQQVHVTTVCDPTHDLIAVRLESDLIASGRLGVKLAFPRGHDVRVKLTPPLDWSEPRGHETRVLKQGRGALHLERKILDTTYFASLRWSGSAALTRPNSHEFILKGQGNSKALELTLTFAPDKHGAAVNRSVSNVLKDSAHYWKSHWSKGGILDLSGSTDPRAAEFEKRVVLSQYLMAVQMAGDVPPQESGLSSATWYGKHHTEMIWWHTAHFALWGRDELLKRNLDWYKRQLPAARELARSRNLKGARWAKMTGPEMRESPGGNPLIVWNQPHTVYLSELLYRNDPRKQTLAAYKDLVLETAECMASMLHFDEEKGRYVLGPPLWIAQEIYDQATSQNPGFELAYWAWSLEVAQTWRLRLGLKRESAWDHILQHLSPLPEKDGKYVALGSNPDTFDNIEHRHDHPTMVAALGLLPGTGVERATMERTLDAVLKTWDWETKIWGWDYPMIAMTATRLGQPETAVDVLLRNGPNNVYLPSGHCPQRSDEAAIKSNKPGARKREIAVYLPANGALLSAVALMTAGWDGNTQPMPGFPKNDRWVVRFEGIKPLP